MACDQPLPALPDGVWGMVFARLPRLDIGRPGLTREQQRDNLSRIHISAVCKELRRVVLACKHGSLILHLGRDNHERRLCALAAWARLRNIRHLRLPSTDTSLDTDSLVSLAPLGGVTHLASLCLNVGLALNLSTLAACTSLRQLYVCLPSPGMLGYRTDTAKHISCQQLEAGLQPLQRLRALCLSRFVTHEWGAPPITPLLIWVTRLTQVSRLDMQLQCMTDEVWGMPGLQALAVAGEGFDESWDSSSVVHTSKLDLLGSQVRTLSFESMGLQGAVLDLKGSIKHLTLVGCNWGSKRLCIKNAHGLTELILGADPLVAGDMGRLDFGAAPLPGLAELTFVSCTGVETLLGKAHLFPALAELYIQLLYQAGSKTELDLKCLKCLERLPRLARVDLDLPPDWVGPGTWPAELLALRARGCQVRFAAFPEDDGLLIE